MLNITFLGTGTSQGVPIIGSDHPVCLSIDKKDKRLRVSVLIQWKDINMVIDCGPDFRQQMLLNNVKKLDVLFFTHEHADHTAGLDDIRPFYFRQGDILVYGTKRVIKNLFKRFNYIFSNKDKYPGAPSVKVNYIKPNEIINLFEKKIIPISFMHNSIPVTGYRINDFAYLTDIKTIKEKELEKLKNLDILVISSLRIKEHPNHMNLEESISLIKKINPNKAYLTHISHLMGFHEEVSKRLPQNIFLAYDNLKIKSN